MKKRIFARTKWLIALVILMVMVACQEDPVSTNPSNNPKIPVDLLFEHDGCKVYRFVDGGSPLYYVHCISGTAMTTWNQHHGKTSVPFEIATDVTPGDKENKP